MTGFIVWIIGYLFTLGCLGDEVTGWFKSLLIFFFWPLALGEMVAEKKHIQEEEEENRDVPTHDV